MERAVTLALGALIFLMGAACAVVARELWDGLRRPRRHGQVDFTIAAARGELLHLDWDDPRPTYRVIDPAGLAVERTLEQPGAPWRVVAGE